MRYADRFIPRRTYAITFIRHIYIYRQYVVTFCVTKTKKWCVYLKHDVGKIKIKSILNRNTIVCIYACI